jgi:hypothetical protein
MFVLLITAQTLACYGLGNCIGRFAWPAPAHSVALETALGIAALIFIGGVLNAVGYAYGTAIDVIYWLGALLGLYRAWRQLTSRNETGPARGAAMRRYGHIYAALVAVVLFYAWFTVPSYSFNAHDDYAQYLFRPLHMLAYGSLGANWFDSVGSDSLGAQSWMQAFFLHRLTIDYATAFDGVVAFGLVCWLVVAIAHRCGAPPWLGLAALFFAVAINPVQVNTSADYSIAMCVLGLFLALSAMLEALRDKRISLASIARATMPVALFVAAAVALKTTALIAMVFMAPVVLVVSYWAAGDIRRWLVAALSCTAFCLLAISPWLWTFRRQFAAIGSLGESAAAELFGPSQAVKSLWAAHYEALISTTPLYGQLGVSVVLAVVVIGLVAISVARKAERMPQRHADRASYFAIAAAVVMTYMFAPLVIQWGHLRYVSPLLIGTFPLALLLGVQAAAPGAGRLRLAPGGIALGVAALAVAGLNANALVARIGGAISYRSTFTIFNSIGYMQQSERDLGPTGGGDLTAIQERTPPGSHVLAMVSTPTQLDFRRNRVSELFAAALAAPWLPDFSRKPPGFIEAYLREMGIDYIIWQKNGMNVVTNATVAPYLTSAVPAFRKTATSYTALLDALSRGDVGATIYETDIYRVIKLR